MPARRFDLVIPKDCAGLRLDQALARLLPALSRSRLQTWMREERVTVEGAAAAPKTRVWGGESVRIEAAPDAAETAFRPEAIGLDIVYEDDTLLAINKPPGLVVHPGSGNWQGTLLNALLHHVPGLAHVPRAGIVHRLDKDTSGLLVVAKTLEAQVNLVRQLQARTMGREYLALVLGTVLRAGSVEAPIGRHPVQRTRMAVVRGGRAAVTHYAVAERLPGCTLLRCRLETGRTHQIRVHMNSIGHPLVGDPVYGARPGRAPAEVREAVAGFHRQALHAARLALVHPATGKALAWEAGLPEDLEHLLQVLRSAADPSRAPAAKSRGTTPRPRVDGRRTKRREM